MKILHIGQLIGGLDIYIRNTITYTDNNFEFIIVHGKKDQNKPIIKNGQIVKEYLIDLYRDLNPWKDIKCLVQAIKIIKKEKPDIIHCHSAKGGFIGRLAGYFTRTKTLYTPHAFSFLSTPNRYKRFIYLTLEKIAKLNSYLLACSESEYRLGIEIIHYNKEYALIWNNAVPKPTEITEPLDTPDQYICYIGRPSYQKNTLFLIDVVKEVYENNSNIHFILLGVGYYSPDLEEVQNKIKKLHLENAITLLPWLSHSETMGYVNKSTFYLSTARYEGLPLAVIEAMALGKAIIASDVPGNNDCIKNDFNGYVLPLNTSVFKEKIIQLVNDLNIRKQFEINSKRFFEEDFNITNRINQLQDIYKQI